MLLWALATLSPSLSVSPKIFPIPTANTSFPSISVPANLHPQLRMTEAWGKLRDERKAPRRLYKGHTSLKKHRGVLLSWLQFSYPCRKAEACSPETYSEICIRVALKGCLCL